MKIVHKKPVEVIVVYGDAGNAKRNILLAAVVAGVVCAGGAAKAGGVLDGVIRFALIGMICVAAAAVLFALHIFRREFWGRRAEHEQRVQLTATIEPRAAAAQPLTGRVVPRAIEAPAFDAAYHLSGPAAQTIRVERWKEPQP